MVYYKDHATISKLLIFNELRSLAQDIIFGTLLDYGIVVLYHLRVSLHLPKGYNLPQIL
jgi:hypothetical protein